ncbi:MAG: trypsin-like serine protease [Bdellovibrionota bacterium]
MKHIYWLFALAISLASPLTLPTAQAEGDYQVLIENGNGVPASGALSDSVALLTYGNGSFCSASFLSPRTLITAGHCFANSIIVNVMKPGGGFYQVRSMRVIRHPGFQNYTDKYGMAIIRNDLSIIQLAQPFPVPVRTVSIAGFPAGQWGQVTDVGYGFRNGHTGGMTLRWGTMQGHLQSIGQFGGRVGLEQRKSNGQNVCPGDSGGAVLYGDQNSRSLVAVHSLANGCGAHSTGASSELVWPAYAWIHSLIL